MSPKEIHKETGKPFFWGRLTAAEKDERDRLHPGMYAAPIAGPSGHVPSPRGGHGGAAKKRKARSSGKQGAKG